MSLKVRIRKQLRDMTLEAAFDTEKESGITGILGASGCGKSMTLKCIAGIVTPDEGRIELNGRILFDSKRRINLKIQDRGVGYLFQSYAMFPHMTIGENVAMALPGSKKERWAGAMEYLAMFHMEDLVHRYPSRLSGGQQQRAALARIMASRPQVLMLDEPFSALDYYLKESLQLELLSELRNYGKEVLLVTHSRDEIYRFCSTIHVIDKGKLVVSGTVKDVFREPKTVSAAKLTGCKNIVGIEYVDSHSFYVPKWKLRVIIREREVPSDTAFIGVRAHSFMEVRDGAVMENAEESTAKSTVENGMECRVLQIFEDPFEVSLMLENGIWWKIPKERWRKEMNETAPKRIAVGEESIFFLRDS